MANAENSCLKKQQTLIGQLFNSSVSRQQLYDILIRMGSQTNVYDPNKQSPAYLVKGCQSDLYLYETFDSGQLFFFTYTEALISAGLARCFTDIYSGETPEVILTCPPLFFDQLKQHLSMGRVQGGESLFMKIKRIAVSYLTKSM